MAKWFVTKELAKLIEQWKRKHPGATVYTIGDANHATDPDVSQHAPEADGAVDAGDFMPGKGGVTMAELADLAEDLRASRDSRIQYVIFRQRIFSRSGDNPWQWRPYRGKYHGHVHVSVNDSREGDDADWNIGGKAPVKMEKIEGKVPVLRKGMSDPIDESGWAHVRRAQRLLGVKVDGDYGKLTAEAVADYRRFAKIGTDGNVIDAALWAHLFGVR